MKRRGITTLVLAVGLALGACSSGSATPSPVATTAASAAASPAASTPASTAPSTAPSSAASGSADCATSTAAPTVNATIQNFAFSPNPIQAKVGDVIGFTNKDSASHTATLDSGSCSTDSIANGATMSLTFTKPGTYPFHCSIHSTMKGTIQVS